jgi:transcriptional regulator with XRE-family HTH domain
MRVQRLSDAGIAQQLGEALRERRLRQDIIQEDLATRVGVSVPTLQKLEKGRGTVQLLIAVLRELNSLDLLSSLLAAPRVSPLQVAKSGKLSRVRASGSRRAAGTPAGAAQPDGAAPALLIPRK